MSICRTQAFYDRWRYSSGNDKERDRERYRERERRRDKWRIRRKDEEEDKLSKEERRERFAMQVRIMHIEGARFF